MAKKNAPLRNSDGNGSPSEVKPETVLSKAVNPAEKRPAKMKPTAAKTSSRTTKNLAGENLTSSVRRASKRTPATGSAVSEEDIALRAYLIYERRRQLGTSGDHHADWAQAELELSADLHPEKTREQNL